MTRFDLEGSPMRSQELLPPEFYERDAVTVARELIGQHLVKDDVILRITETEAYVGAHDTACHARSGLTRRNAPLWGPPGRAYVYLCYGLHWMLNVVADREGWPAAVLIRACEPVAGLEVIRERRGGKTGPVLLTGPGKVGAALAVDGSWSHHSLTEPGGLELRAGPSPEGILVGPRVGIDYASPEHRDAPWRFAMAGSPWVSQRRSLSAGESEG